MGPDPSAGFNSKVLIDQGFRGPFLINSSCNDFESFDEGRKMSSQLWVRMAGYRNYISSRNVFISSFVSIIKYAGRKLNNLMWLHMSGYLNYISYKYVFISSFFRLQSTRDKNWTIWCGYVWWENSCQYIFLGIVLAFNCGYVYCMILKLYIIYIRFYLLFCFTDKVRGMKTEHTDVSTYVGRIQVHKCFVYGYLANVSTIECG